MQSPDSQCLDTNILEIQKRLINGQLRFCKGDKVFLSTAHQVYIARLSLEH